MEEKDQLALIYLQLKRIADTLEVFAKPDPDRVPDYVFPIGEFHSFDWSAIGASIVRSDKDGPTHIRWNDQVYTRRSPVNKYSPAIWYSRATGKDGDGNNEYAKLITFREISDPDPVSEKARALTGSAPQRQPAESIQDPRPAVSSSSSAPATQNKTGKPGATAPSSPAPSAPSSPASKLDPVSYIQYKANAKAKSISPEAAYHIARTLCGIPAENDHSRPNSFLPFFYEAKHAGLSLSGAWTHLEERGFNIAKAISELPKDK